MNKDLCSLQFNGKIVKVEGGFKQEFPIIVSTEYYSDKAKKGDYSYFSYWSLVNNINKLTAFSELYLEVGSLEPILKLKELNATSILVALEVREKYSVPMLFTLKRVENELGRVVRPYRDAAKEKHNPVSRRRSVFAAQNIDLFGKATFKYYTRQYNGKEFAEALLPLVNDE